MKMATLPVLLGLALAAPALPDDRVDLDWLAGHWCAQNDKGSFEEHWLPARGGLLLGLGRSVAKQRTQFEFLRIELAGAKTRYVAQPGGAPPTSFALVEARAGQVTFANPQHDFPKRIRYSRSADTLTARVDDGSDDGQALEFEWRPCKTAADVK